MKKNLTIASIIIAIIFGIIFLPKIYNRINSESIVDSSRTEEVSNDAKLAFIKLNGVARKVPEFIFKNQDNLYISNEDYNGKVFVAEFFFTTCPTICVEMNQNMKILDEEFGDRKDFGIASFTLITIISPTDAYLLLEPPNTFIHSTLLAPVLSATVSSVCICIIFQLPAMFSF